MSDSIREQRLQEIAELRAQGVNPYPHEFERTHTTDKILETFAYLQPEQTLESETVHCAGRVIAIRDHGKSAFFVISDYYGKIQVTFAKPEWERKRTPSSRSTSMSVITRASSGSLFAQRPGS